MTTLTTDTPLEPPAHIDPALADFLRLLSLQMNIVPREVEQVIETSATLALTGAGPFTIWTMADQDYDLTRIIIKAVSVNGTGTAPKIHFEAQQSDGTLIGLLSQPRTLTTTAGKIQEGILGGSSQPSASGHKVVLVVDTQAANTWTVTVRLIGIPVLT